MYELFGKRLLDILIVSIATIILSPLMIAIATMIKISDPGPVLFKQNRAGHKGRIFLFYKFRSMPVDTTNLPSDKVGDIQLSWIGRLIRRANLDELPQLFNILKGDMSVVGPRPPLPEQLELLEIRTSNGAINSLPGLTGLAQIKSFDRMSIVEKAAFDGIYVNKISLLNDIKIIFGTFRYLLKPPPVY